MSLPNKGKILALDIGTRRTGVAISDSKQRVAFVREEIEHESTETLLKDLVKLLTAEKIVGILIGLPVSMSGEETKQTQIVKAVIERIQSETEIPIQTIDERLSSKEAKETSGRRQIDSEAALILLQTHLS